MPDWFRKGAGMKKGVRIGLSRDETREFLNKQNENYSTASRGDKMDRDMKILPKNILNDTYESGDLCDMSNKELKNMVSDILTENLNKRLKVPEIKKP